MATYNELLGSTFYDKNNEKIGELDNLYLDDETDKPEWITVRTVMCGNKVSFIPFKMAKETDDGL